MACSRLAPNVFESPSHLLQIGKTTASPIVLIRIATGCALSAEIAAIAESSARALTRADGHYADGLGGGDQAFPPNPTSPRGSPSIPVPTNAPFARVVLAASLDET